MYSQVSMASDFFLKQAILVKMILKRGANLENVVVRPSVILIASESNEHNW